MRMIRHKAAMFSSAVAVSTVLAAGAAHGQAAFNAPDPVVNSGSVGFDRGVTTPNTDVYTINSPTAVLTFTPSDTATGGGQGNPIDFMGSGTTAIFQGAADFTVLNRIVPADPARPIALSGNVVSQITGAAAPVRGGSVWFYSPGGIIAGDGAVFDVGNLLLSTADPTGGTGTIGSTSTFNLSSADPNGIVNILSGATINAPNAGSYVALVAPVVFQAGTVNTNGAAAYVAAQQASLNFAGGLFTINVTLGSSAAGGFPLQHRGSTIFADTAAAHRAYLVAVPANSAITTVIESGGTLGFATATAANIDNGVVVLSAGPTVVNDTPNIFSAAPATQANIAISSGRFNASTRVEAFDNVSIVPTLPTGPTVATGQIDFARDLNVLAGGNATVSANTVAPSVTTMTIGRNVNVTVNPEAYNRAPGGDAVLGASNGSTLTVGGSAIVQSRAIGRNGGLSVTAGDARIAGTDGNISIAGDALVQSRPDGFTQPGLIDGGDTQAGDASVFSGAGRTLSIGGNLTVNAFANGGANSGGGDSIAGAGRGGNANLGSGGGAVTVTGNVVVDAGGTGGNKIGSATGSAGAGIGGTATVNVSAAGGSITIGGATTVSANGIGGTVTGPGTGGNGGDAVAGRAFLSLNPGAGSGTLDLTGAVALNAVANGGTGLIAGNGGGVTSGIADLRVFGGTATLRNSVNISTNVNSGAGVLGGGITITPMMGAGLGANGGTLAITGGATLSGNAVGGASSGAAATGVSATGGLAGIETRGGAMTIGGAVSVSASALGGAATGNGATAAGSATGGQAFVLANSGALTAGATSVQAGGTGGTRANGTAGAASGGARGGSANISADAGALTLASLTANTTGTPGTVTSGIANGGSAQGGNTSLSTVAGSFGGNGAVTVNGPATLLAGANPGNGLGAGASGGNATGGDARLTANGGGDVVVSGLLTINVNATAGAGGAGGVGGAGAGGTGSVSQGTGGFAQVGSATIGSFGIGGASSGGVGGTGRGGDVRFVSNDGTIRSLNAVTLQANGIGGNASGGATAGGAGFGGLANIGADAQLTEVLGAAQIIATGAGGNGGTTALGGAGTGGQAILGTIGAGRVQLSQILNSNATGTGGVGTNGGAGTGGTAQIFSTTGQTAVTGAATLLARGVGGQAASGSGGAGTGGLATVTSDGTTTLGLLQAVASAQGGFKAGGATGSGGAAQGGRAIVTANSGALNIADSALVNSVATGGSVAVTGATGNGGDARGGESRLSTFLGGGSTTVGGTASIVAGGFGGAGGGVGARGGNGTGGAPGDATNGPFNQGAYLVANGGPVTLGGDVFMSADGQGGVGGIGGAGGTGFAGYVNAVAFGSTLSQAPTATFTMQANGIGGFGGIDGGAGGAGESIGGIVLSAASGGGSTPAGTASSVTLGSVEINADTFGGAGNVGATGAAGAPGGAGGRGGDANALGQAFVNAVAQAGSGTLNVQSLTVSANGTAGDGGLGGAGGSGAAGGAGGAGGNGFGGFTNIGTISGGATTGNSGSATLGQVSLDQSGSGGFGGDGGAGATQGAGGAGGLAEGGNGAILSRGAPVTADDIFIYANAIGGDGGAGSTAGANGGATGGVTSLFASTRFQRTERGSLTGGTLTLDSEAVGGTSGLAPDGASLAGTSTLSVTDSDVGLTGVNIFTGGAAPAPAGFRTNVTVANGTLAVANVLNIQAIGDLGLSLYNGGRLAAGNIAADVSGTIDFSIPTGATVGLFDVDDNIFIQTGGDFTFLGEIGADPNDLQTGAFFVSSGGAITLGNVRVGGELGLSATGPIVTANLESAGASVFVNANNAATASVTVGNVRAADSIFLSAETDVTAGTLTALTQPAVLAGGGEGGVIVESNGVVRVGDVSGIDIDIDNSEGAGAITVGNITGEIVEVLGGANVTVGNVATREIADGGGGVADDNRYFAQLGAVGNLTVGDVNALGLVALASLEGSATAGAVTTPSSLIAAAANNVTLGAVTTGPAETVFVANSSLLDSDPAFAALLDDNDPVPFDTAILASTTPPAIGGALSFTGAVNSGLLNYASTTGLAAQAITTTAGLELAGPGPIRTGDLTSLTDSVTVSSPAAIVVGNVTAGDSIILAGQSGAATITAGNLTAATLVAGGTTTGIDGLVDVETPAAVRIGAITAAAIDINTDTDSSPGPYGDIVTGDLAAESVEVAGLAGVTVGNVIASDRFPDFAGAAPAGFPVLLAAGTNLVAGNVTGAGTLALVGQSGSVTAGVLTTPGTAAVFAGANATLAGATTGRGAQNSLFVANSSLLRSNATLAGIEEAADLAALNPALFATLAPARIGGALAITGPVSTGNFRVAATGGASFGALDATTQIFVDSGAGITGGNIVTPAVLQLQATGAVAVGDVNAGSVNLISLGSTVQAGSITSQTGIGLGSLGTQAGGVTAGTLVANGGPVVVNATAGNATIGNVQIAAGQSQPGLERRLRMNVGGAITTGSVTAPDDVALVAIGGGITTGALTTGGSALLLAGGGVTTGAITAAATGNEFVFIGNSSQRTLIANQQVQTPSGQPVTVANYDAFLTAAPARTGGAVAINGAVTGALFRAGAGGAFTLAGPAQVGTRFGVAATGAAGFGGLVNAATIDVESSDIQIGQTAGLGSSRTTTLALTGTGNATLGGAGTAAGYLLDGAEAGRLRAASISFTGGGATGDQGAGGSVTVRDLTLTAGGDGGNLTSGSGLFTIRSLGSLLVDGNVRLNNAATGNGLAFIAAGSFQLATDAGSIGVFGAGDALGGRLSISATDIAVGQRSLLGRAGELDDLEDNEVPGAIRLIAAPSGQNRAEGFLQANALDFTARDYLLIQNSNTAAEFGGFTANSVSITSTAAPVSPGQGGAADPTAGLNVVVYGRVRREDGTFAINDDTRGLIRYVSRGGDGQVSDLSGFSAISQVNNCLIASDVCTPPIEPETAPQIATDITSIVAAIVAASNDPEGVAAVPTVNLVTVIDAAALDTGSLVQEPVTSGGNSSLWGTAEGGGGVDDDIDGDGRSDNEEEDGK